ncbi:MAG: porin [Bradymonadia bacterium]|jgi:opacity protein-like surface antigen
MTATLFALALLADLNAAGSIYVNQPTLISPADGDEERALLSDTNYGLNAEVAFKVVADVDEHLSASAKVCYGCHGFMADMAYFDWSIYDALNVRAGRFPVPFGEFYLRHDPANHRSATKPLPYEMGRMLRRTQYNLAVLPEPYPDNGVELFGTVRGEVVEFSYSAYAVAGLKGDAATGDLDFIRSRTEYVADNNRTPSVGGRVTFAFPNLPGSDWRWVALGASAMWGHYDDDGELSYLLGGIDFYTRYDRLNLRSEVLFRRTEIADEPDRYRQALEDLFHQRDGFYVEVDGPLASRFEWLARVDGFRRAGPLLRSSALSSTDSSILRYTAGINVLPVSGMKLKLEYEYWDFSEFDAAQIIHTGLVGTF